jgi:Zn-dependent metalloprotease
VHTKRLIRLIVTPGPLAYALFGFMAGLAWLSLTSLASPLPESPRAVTAPANGRVNLQGAIDSVRRFAGQPDLALDGGLQTDDQGARGAGLFYIETTTPIRGENFYKVDAATGEVIEATLRDRLGPEQTSTEITFAEAEQRAARFARTPFWGFEQLQIVDRSSRTSESGSIHSFKWTQISPGSGAELPISVSIAVSGRNGQVFWYLSQRDPLKIDATPAINKDQALEIASSWLAPRDSRWALDDPISVRLQVLYDDDDQQQLIWSVTFRAVQDGPRPSIRLLVDGQTGQILQGAA